MRHDYEPRPLAEPHESACWTFCRCIAYPFAALGVVVVLNLVTAGFETPLFDGFIQWITFP